jgi:hypothetical protein
MTPGAPSDLRLASLDDGQVSRIVSMVDALPIRGDADALIEPLRARLSKLRPNRPVSFTRLLFKPLDPVIMPTAEWHHFCMGLPRPPHPLLAAEIERALPQYRGVIDEAGALPLWPDAADIFDAMAMPHDWPEKTGLPPTDFSAVAAAAASVLHEAIAIERALLTQVREAPEILRAILSRSRTRGPVAMDTVIAVLLARFPDPARVAAIAAEFAGSDRSTTRALDRLASNLSGRLASATDLREAAAEAGRVASLITALEQGAPAHRLARLVKIRAGADALCRRCFAKALEDAVARATAAGIGAIEDAAMTELEWFARDLRRLEAAGRKLGSGEFYTNQLVSAVAMLFDLPGALTVGDRVRLVEILADPDAALRLLQRS